MANLITGLFDTETAAEQAVSRLKTMGYGQNEITIIMKDRSAASGIAHEAGSRTMAGVGTGAALGGTIGAVIAGLIATGTILIPGVNVIAAGALAAALAGAGAGGATGGLIGWLASAGIPDDVAPYYERGLHDGGIVVAIAAHAGDEERVRKVLDGGAVLYGGSNASTYMSPQFQARYGSTADRLPGIQTGGHDADGSPDTRGISEKVPDAVTGDPYDDKTGKIAT